MLSLAKMFVIICDVDNQNSLQLTLVKTSTYHIVGFPLRWGLIRVNRIYKFANHHEVPFS